MYELDLPGASTGDAIIDKWESEIRSGIVPDLMEDLPKEEADKILDWSRKAYKNKQAKGMISPDAKSNIGDRIDELDELLGSKDTFKEEY
jgi:hypothetical protein